MAELSVDVHRTLAGLPETWREDAIHWYSQGASDAEVRQRALGGMAAMAFKYMIRMDPEFGEVIRMGREKAEAWWHEQGREGIKDRNFNQHAYQFQVVNRSRLGWDEQWYAPNREAPVVNVNAISGPAMSDRELARQIALLLHQASKDDEVAAEVAKSVEIEVVDVVGEDVKG